MCVYVYPDKFKLYTIVLLVTTIEKERYYYTKPLNIICYVDHKPNRKHRSSYKLYFPILYFSMRTFELLLSLCNFTFSILIISWSLSLYAWSGLYTNSLRFQQSIVRFKSFTILSSHI